MKAKLSITSQPCPMRLVYDLVKMGIDFVVDFGENTLSYDKSLGHLVLKNSSGKIIRAFSINDPRELKGHWEALEETK